MNPIAPAGFRCAPARIRRVARTRSTTLYDSRQEPTIRPKLLRLLKIVRPPLRRTLPGATVGTTRTQALGCGLRKLAKRLLFAATLRAAGFEVSHILNVLTAADTQITDRWQGCQLGIISFVYGATTARGVAFGGNFASYGGWGLYPAATPQRIVQSLDDIRRFLASFHLLAQKIGNCSVKMRRAQTTIRFGWIASYLFSYANQPPMERERHLDLPPSSSGEGEAPDAESRCGRAG